MDYTRGSLSKEEGGSKTIYFLNIPLYQSNSYLIETDTLILLVLLVLPIYQYLSSMAFDYKNFTTNAHDLMLSALIDLNIICRNVRFVSFSNLDLFLSSIATCLIHNVYLLPYLKGDLVPLFNGNL